MFMFYLVFVYLLDFSSESSTFFFYFQVCNLIYESFVAHVYERVKPTAKEEDTVSLQRIRKEDFKCYQNKRSTGKNQHQQQQQQQKQQHEELLPQTKNFNTQTAFKTH